MARKTIQELREEVLRVERTAPQGALVLPATIGHLLATQLFICDLAEAVIAALKAEPAVPGGKPYVLQCVPCGGIEGAHAPNCPTVVKPVSPKENDFSGRLI